MVKTVGIVSAGDMGSGIGSVLTHGGMDVVTSLDGRGDLTRLRAGEAGMRDVGSLDAVVEACGVFLSVLVPAQAAGLGERVAESILRTGARPVYVECNAISPKTVARIAELIAPTGVTFVDAGIIGSPPKPAQAATRLYCSGPDTAAFEALAEFGLNVRRAGPEIGQASGLKMVYAASTKGTTAVWTELLLGARALGMTDALIAELAPETNAISRRLIDNVPDMPRRARRWVGEMEEIAATFEELGLTPRILLGAADLYRLVSETPLADQTSREPNPDLDAMLDVLVEHLRARKASQG
jgi:3-hydroxyisobutyrate dehydrogenase-like beta-hydroxyacid dehydrogenase